VFRVFKSTNLGCCAVYQQNDKSTIDENTSNGGLGFIGSHTVVELQNEGFEVVIVDDLLIRRKSIRRH
jgi:UDP-glucose 4-epimerase